MRECSGFTLGGDDIVEVVQDRKQVKSVQNMWVHSSIRIDGGKTQVWNGAGVKPAICEVLDRVAQAADPEAKVWKGSEVPPNQQGLKILGAPFGHREFVVAQLEKKLKKQETLIRPSRARSTIGMVDPDALRQC